MQEVAGSIPASPLDYFYFSLLKHGSVFGRVVKAVALGAILVRGTGSNPVARMIFSDKTPWPSG